MDGSRWKQYHYFAPCPPPKLTVSLSKDSQMFPSNERSSRLTRSSRIYHATRALSGSASVAETTAMH